MGVFHVVRNASQSSFFFFLMEAATTIALNCQVWNSHFSRLTACTKSSGRLEKLVLWFVEWPFLEVVHIFMNLARSCSFSGLCGLESNTYTELRQDKKTPLY